MASGTHSSGRLAQLLALGILLASVVERSRRRHDQPADAAQPGGGAPDHDPPSSPAEAGSAASPAEAGSSPGDEGGPNPLDRVLDRIDRLQRRHRMTAFTFGVVKKFTEDRAGQLAALVAYYSFFSIFPLLLALVTILGFVLSGNEDLQERIVDSALAQFPLLGDQISDNVGTIEGSAVALGIGLSGAVWGGLRAMTAAQNAMDEVWDVPMFERPNFIFSRVRGLLMLMVLAAGVTGSIVVANVASVVEGLPGAGRAALFAGSVALNVVVVGVAFQVLTDLALRIRQILPGAIIGGFSYWVLQYAGSEIVRRSYAGAQGTYGTFAVVIGLLTWLFVLAQVTLVAAEINVVWSRRLWPRSLTGRDLTNADVEAFAAYARQAKRNEVVQVQIVAGVRPGADAPAPAGR